jgi:hypothetical protein
MRFFQNGEFFWVALILAFLAFKRINSHKATKVFRLWRDRHEIHRDTFEQSEYGASLSWLKRLVMKGVAIWVVLRSKILAGDPAFQKNIAALPTWMLLAEHFLSQFLEMRSNLGNLRLALKSQLRWKLWQSLVLANIANTEQLAVDQ